MAASSSFFLRNQAVVNNADVSAANPLPVTMAGGGGGASAAAFALTNSASGTMGVTASVVVPYSATRKWVMITNRTAGAEIQDVGSSNVTVGGGIPLTPSSGFLFNQAGAAGPIYGITTVANSPWSYVEA